MWTIRHARGPQRLPTLPLLGMTMLGMSLLLVGCGGAGAANEAPGAGGAGTPTVGASSARLVGTVTISAQPTRSPIPPVTLPTATATPGPAGGAPAGGAMVVLTPASAHTTVTVKVGQLIQAQLPVARTWAYVGQTGATLPAIAPSGDRSASVYLWTFRAQMTGATTLHFTGKTVCSAGVPCLPADITLNFGLRIIA